MHRSKHARKDSMHKRFGKKAVVSAAALALVGCLAVGGTVSWLIDKTDKVTNTFTYGDINITLTEETGPEYIMLPGNTLDKDPKVTVKANSEDCWLFVKIEESNFSDFMTYAIADGWTKLQEATETVYFRSVDKGTADTEFAVLKDDQVVVKDNVTKEMLNALTEGTYPTLTFTAYAVQRDADIDAIDSAAEAWALASTPTQP